MYLKNSTMIGLLRKKPQHGGMPGYGGGGNHGHYDHEVYSEEDEESFFSDGEDNADDNEQSQYSDEEEEEEEEDASQYSEYYDEESIDPELLCPTCNTQTHEYVLKGTILKKWKRMPVEDPHVVDESTGECVTCRVAKLKHDLLDDLPVLPDKWLPASQKQKQQQDQPPPPPAAKSTPVVSNRKSSSSISSFSTGTSRSSKQQDEEESVSLFDEVSHGVSSFSCGLSRASGRMAPLLEVPEREDTSFEESSDESEEESLTTEKDKDKLNKNLIAKDEEEATFEDATKRTPTVFSGQTELFQDFLNDHAASPFKKDAAPRVETVSADRQPQEHAAAAAAAVGSASTSVPNGAADTSVVVSDVLEHYIEEKDFNSTKKKMAEMGRSFRGIFAGRKNKNGDKKEVESEEEVDKGKEEEEVKVKEVGKEIKEKDQDPPPVAALVQPKSELVLAQQWYQEEDKQVPPASSPAPIAPVPVPITPTEEKDPQEFYDEAAAAVAAAATASKPSEKNKKKLPYIFHRNSKKKKESVKDKATEKEGINQNEVKIPKIIGGDVSFGFPDLLPEDNQVSSSSKLVRDQEDQLLSRNNAVKVEANHDLPIEAFKTGITKDDKVNHGPSAPPNVSTDATKKDDKPTKKFGMKKLGITKKKSKKESSPTGGKTAEEMVEEPDNPFLPPNVSPVFKSNAAKAAAPKQRSSLAIAAAPIFASFPDNLLSTVPEDEPDNSPPPPVLEIATGPDEDDDIPNPNTTDVAHLIKGLRTIKDDPRLARKFLVSLRTMSIHHPNRVGIAEAGGIQAIVTCMSRFKRESAVAKQGCAVLQNLVCADCNEHRCAEEGGLDAIVRAMMTHIRSPGTQEHGAAALRNLTAGSLINRTAVAEAGGIEAVVKAMKVHPRSVVVQEKGCAALGNLCIKHAANRVDVGKAGGIHVVVQALARHGYKSRGVSEKGIRCLLNLSYAPSNIEMLKWEAGIEGLVLGVAHRHGGRCKEWALKIFLKM